MKRDDHATAQEWEEGDAWRMYPRAYCARCGETWDDEGTLRVHPLEECIRHLRTMFESLDRKDQRE